MNCEIGRDVTLQELREKYDRVIVNIAGSKKYGPVKAMAVKRDCHCCIILNVQHEEDKYKQKYHGAVRWGGGNVAMDCARSLVRILGEVTVIYRRSQKEMPANQIEIEEAKKEGVKFAFLENISKRSSVWTLLGKS